MAAPEYDPVSSLAVVVGDAGGDQTQAQGAGAVSFRHSRGENAEVKHGGRGDVGRDGGDQAFKLAIEASALALCHWIGPDFRNALVHPDAFTRPILSSRRPSALRAPAISVAAASLLIEPLMVLNVPSGEHAAAHSGDDIATGFATKQQFIEQQAFHFGGHAHAITGIYRVGLLAIAGAGEISPHISQFKVA